MSSSWENTAPTGGEPAPVWGAAAPGADGADGGDAWGSGGDAAPEEPPKPELSQEERVAQARDHGWTKPTAINYEDLQQSDGHNADWHATAKVYQWDDSFGDVAPAVPELEKILFRGEFQMKKGAHLKALDVEVRIEGLEKVSPIRTFADAGLHPVVLDNVEKCGYDKPTPIQAYTIPAVLQDIDVHAVAQTGSGKTAAYMVPVVSRLMGKAKKLCAAKPNISDPSYNPKIHMVKAEPLVVIVVPTRELAMQIFDEARRMCYRSMLRPCVAYGGLPPMIGREELGKGCDILIATPGRLVDLMSKPHILSMNRVKYTIIDEADELLQADWEEELTKIMAGGDSNDDADHVYLMFSATFAKGGRRSARDYLANDHLRIRVGRPGSAHKNIHQEIIQVDQNAKQLCLWNLLMAGEPDRTLIFCNSKPTVDLVDDYLFNAGLPCTSFHSGRGQREREDAVRAFRRGQCPIMIATGVSARGLDIMDVKHVINYDLPSGEHDGIDQYIHRIGRTARIGHKGLATSFYNDRSDDLAQELVNVLVESGSPVPDFLSHLKPEEGVAPDFGDDSDEEDEAADGFGGQEGGVSTWGADAPPEGADAGGFAADAGGFAADAGGFTADAGGFAASSGGGGAW